MLEFKPKWGEKGKVEYESKNRWVSSCLIFTLTASTVSLSGRISFNQLAPSKGMFLRSVTLWHFWRLFFSNLSHGGSDIKIEWSPCVSCNCMFFYSLFYNVRPEKNWSKTVQVVWMIEKLFLVQVRNNGNSAEFVINKNLLIDNSDSMTSTVISGVIQSNYLPLLKLSGRLVMTCLTNLHSTSEKLFYQAAGHE